MATTRQSSASKSPASKSATRSSATPAKQAARPTGVTRKASKRPATRPAKPAAPVKPVQTKTAQPPKVDKKTKTEKVKVVRDSFTIPKAEYACIAEMKKRALGLGAEVKKSELIRAGLALLVALPDLAFSKALAQVPTLKTGRPGKA